MITSDHGVQIVTDPYDPKVGYKLPDVTADIVTTSHHHYDHNNISAIKGKFLHIREPVDRTFGGIGIKAVPTWHEP